MNFIDTHTHLYLKEFNADRQQVMENASLAGIGKILLPNIDSSTVQPLLDMVRNHPGICYPMIGLHPGSVKDNVEKELQIIRHWESRERFIAIGEIGIDLYWDKTFFEQQLDAFTYQVKWAQELNLPVVIHCRDAFNEIITILEAEHKPGLRGVFHSFTGNSEQAQRITGMGFMIGLNGILTFNNPGLQKVVQETDLEFLLIETDAPFLAPTPHRGKRNESAFLVHIAEKLAELKNMTLEEIATITSGNAMKLFTIPE